MASTKDYYEILEVERTADAKTIKRAYLKKARELHPDVSDDPAAEEKFKEVNEAYSVLSDEQKRYNYDNFGSADGPSGFGGSGFVDFDDIFSTFFGGSSQRAASTRKARTHGRDMAIALFITLEEAASGCSKQISYTREAPCKKCEGTGLGKDGHMDTCPDCQGKGFTVSYRQTFLGTSQTQTVCPRCQGTGQVVVDGCKACHGTGRTQVKENVTVNIPAGIYDGQQIRMSGQGEAGLRGDVAGDLLITVDIEKDPRFERQGDTLFHVLDVDAIDAMVGDTVQIDGILPDEKIEVVIKPQTQYGDRVVIPQKGMPIMNTSARGDLVCVMNVYVPDDLVEEDMDELKKIQERRHKTAAKKSKAKKSSKAQVKSETASDAKKKSERPRKKTRKKKGGK